MVLQGRQTEILRTLDAELENRIRNLRNQYSYMKKALLARSEIRIEGIAPAIRRTRIGNLPDLPENPDDALRAISAMKDVPDADVYKDKPPPQQSIIMVQSSPSKIPSMTTSKRKAMTSPSKTSPRTSKKGKLGNTAIVNPQKRTTSKRTRNKIE